MRKCELLHLPSFAAHSCLVTHDRGNNGAEELGQGKEKNNKADGDRETLCTHPYPLQSHNYLIPQPTQEELGPWLFSCYINHMSSWLGFRLFTYLGLLWVIPTKAESVKKKSLNGCFCSDCGTKCFKSPLSIILGHCKPENNPAGCRTNARIPGIRFILKLDLSQKNSSFTSGDMVLSQLICTSLKTEEETLPLPLFIIKMLRSSSGKLGDKAAAAFYTVTHMLLLTCMEFTEHILMIIYRKCLKHVIFITLVSDE